MSPHGGHARLAIRKLNVIGFGLVVLFLCGFGSWASMSELAGAVIAPGSLVVDSSVKKIQHPSGGVVSDILVRDGDVVQEGQVLIRLDATVTGATVGAVQSQLDELMAREARLLAERDGATAISFPEALIKRQNEPSVASAIMGEKKLFDSRSAARSGQRSQLQERVSQTKEEIRGLTAQQESKDSEISYIGEELSGVTQLYKQKLISITRYTQLQRDQAKLQGDRGQLIADIARARGKVSEIELQIIQLDQDSRTEVLKDLRETQGKIAELNERITAAEDQLNRIEIRAPQSGTVHQLAVHTVGGVIRAGETIMEIVPRGDQLVVEAKVPPSDIDQVATGQHAEVRIKAGNARTMPELQGVLTLVSADLTHEVQAGSPTGQAYYLVRIVLPSEQVRRLGGFHLMPGMPAEAFVQTQTRTPLSYLLKPLREQMARAFRER
jgi:HlyD family secretion protein